jgi:SAM-dependent methyltransferase
MNDKPRWSHGYVTDTSYADKFFRELSPTWLNYVAAINGGAPRVLDQPFTYLELGCGFGNSTVVNAAAFPQGEFHACDFNPAHVEGGVRHAAALGVSNVYFHESSFDRLLSIDLPPFDFIVLHGVYSWVGAEARQAVRRVLSKKLKSGGLVYLSYNCLPGWATEVPLRRLLLELAAADGATPERTELALGTLKQLSDSKLRYFTANPSAMTSVDAYLRGTSNYVAHEFLNETWEPFYSVDVADDMAEVEAQYLGSATLVDNHPTLVVDGVASEVIARLATPRQRQLATDFATNQRFRRDVFIRRPSAIAPAEMTRHLHEVAFGSIGSPEAITTKARVPRGEIRFQEDFIRDLQSLMRKGSMTLGQAITTLDAPSRDEREIARNLIFLIAAGTLMPFAKAIHSVPGKSEKFANPTTARALADVMARRSSRAIPSQVLGNGIEIQPIEAIAVLEWMAGAQTVEALTRRLEDRQKPGTSDGAAPQVGDVRPAVHPREIATDVAEKLIPTFTRLGLIV